IYITCLIQSLIYVTDLIMKQEVCRTTPPHLLPILMRLSEVSAFSGLHPNTIRRAIERGDLPALRRTSRSAFFHRKDILEWLGIGDPQPSLPLSRPPEKRRNSRQRLRPCPPLIH